MSHHTERDRNEKNEKNEKDTGRPVQLDKDNKPGQQNPGQQNPGQQHPGQQRPIEHERPQQGGEQHSGGGMKK